MSFAVIALPVLLILAITLWRQDPDALELSLSLPFNLDCSSSRSAAVAMKSDGEGLLQRLPYEVLELPRVPLEVLGLEVRVLLVLVVWAPLEAVLHEALRALVELDQRQVHAPVVVLVLVHLLVPGLVAATQTMTWVDPSGSR